MSNELPWLKRRLQIIDRAIAEMEVHEVKPHLSEVLNPDIAGALEWARDEKVRVESELKQLGVSSHEL